MFSKQPSCYAVLSPIRLCNSMTVSCWTPLFMESFRQEYWNGLPYPPPGDLPDSVIEPMSLASLSLAGRFFTTELPGKPNYIPSNKIRYWDFKGCKLPLPLGTFRPYSSTCVDVKDESDVFSTISSICLEIKSIIWRRKI